MPMKVRCSCGHRLLLKDEAAGKQIRCPVCKGIFRAPIPPPPAGAQNPATVAARVPQPEPAASAADTGAAPLPPLPASAPTVPAGWVPPPDSVGQLSACPVGRLLLLNLVTLNVGATIWLNLLHGELPQRRRSDPSAQKAIGFLFIPFFNLYWYFFTYFRLLTRLNEQRMVRGLPPLQLGWLVILAFVLMFVPPIYGAVLNLLFFVPLLLTAVQSGVNALVEVSGLPPNGRSPGAVLAADLRAGRDLRQAWGLYLLVLSGPSLAIAAFITVALWWAGDGLNLAGTVATCVTMLGCVGGVSLFWRAGRMDSDQARLDRDPAEVEAVQTRQRQTSARVRLAWALGCLATACAITLPLLTKIVANYADRARLEATARSELKWQAQNELNERLPGLFYGLSTAYLISSGVLISSWLVASAVLCWQGVRLRRSAHSRPLPPPLPEPLPWYASANRPADVEKPVPPPREEPGRQRSRRIWPWIAGGIGVACLVVAVQVAWLWKKPPETDGATGPLRVTRVVRARKARLGSGWVHANAPNRDVVVVLKIKGVPWQARASGMKFMSDSYVKVGQERRTFNALIGLEGDSPIRVAAVVPLEARALTLHLPGLEPLMIDLPEQILDETTLTD